MEKDNYEKRRLIPSEQDVLLSKETSVNQTEKKFSIFGCLYFFACYWHVFAVIFLLVYGISSANASRRQREYERQIKEIQKQKEELENKKQGNTGKDSYQTKTPEPGFTSSPISKDSYWSVFHDDYEEDYDYWYDDYDVYDYDSPEEFYEYNKNQIFV